MTVLPRTSLEQWAVLAAVVDEGSFARAAEALNKSQSSVSYTLKCLQEQLPVDVLVIRGRRAELSEAGEVLLRRARSLIEDLRSLERLATNLAQDWEPEVRLAVDVIFPPPLLSEAMAQFVPESRSTRVQIIESVLSGGQEALLSGYADLAITHRPPPGFLGNELIRQEFVAVAHCDHPLAQSSERLTLRDLRHHRQFVVRDSGLKRKQDAGWLGAEQRWTVTHLKTSIQFVKQGLGYAWLPRLHIAEELGSGELVPLALEEGGSRQEVLSLVFADRDSAGPATRALARALQSVCQRTGP
ncbi:LysR family transcriptional regulator [Marinobacter mobilis]|uniref:DNA-binding transcriptional regulator, LysR family n=1 Tax=Marinobacter mobilis TaxID=488533 RepID=A0A1H2WS65_9GAMM|nr:LysR family transcriptional regulator [Marinobacter mobilis]SDW83513.1 DNA-binding transcriptional regulator, LysR family [Marinobacter mobilis]